MVEAGNKEEKKGTLVAGLEGLVHLEKPRDALAAGGLAQVLLQHLLGEEQIAILPQERKLVALAHDRVLVLPVSVCERACVCVRACGESQS